MALKAVIVCSVENPNREREHSFRWLPWICGLQQLFMAAVTFYRGPSHLTLTLQS